MPNVSFARGETTTEGRRASLPVSGSDWRETAALQNWTASRNRVLIPAFRPGVTLTSKNEFSFACRLDQSATALMRRWTVSGRGAAQLCIGLNFGAKGCIEAPEFESLDFGEGARRRTFYETVTAPGDAFVNATLQVEVETDPVGGAAGDYVIDSIECHEVPRQTITTAEGGHEPGRFRSGQPINAATMTPIIEGSQMPRIGRRVLAHTMVPYAIDGTPSTNFVTSNTTATFQDIWPVNLPATARHIHETSAPSERVYASVFAWVSPGGAGEFHLVSDSEGPGAPVSVTNTTPAWLPPAAASVRFDDSSNALGLQSGAYDAINVQARATSGTIYVASVLAYESPA